MHTNAPVWFLMGPTASGKTAVACRLADELPVELINVDAAQVYRGMNIGAAKPDAQTLARYPHHLIDICDISDTYSAARFRRDVIEIIADIHGRGKVPLLVGGTMFYFKVLEQGISELPESDAATRAAIDDEFAKLGMQVMHQRLLEIDPKLANTIKLGDRQRIQRALEIYSLTKQAPSEVMAQNAPVGIANPILKMALFSANRAQLHANIALRFEQMLEQGLVAEVEGLVNGLAAPENYPALRAVGYRQTLDYLQGRISMDDLLLKGTAATRQLAKRQLTWLRHSAGLYWLLNDHPLMQDAIVSICQQSLQGWQR